jgi:hypothetical protein
MLRSWLALGIEVVCDGLGLAFRRKGRSAGSVAPRRIFTSSRATTYYSSFCSLVFSNPNHI